MKRNEYGVLCNDSVDKKERGKSTGGVITEFQRDFCVAAAKKKRSAQPEVRDGVIRSINEASRKEKGTTSTACLSQLPDGIHPLYHCP